MGKHRKYESSSNNIDPRNHYYCGNLQAKTICTICGQERFIHASEERWNYSPHWIYVPRHLEEDLDGSVV